MAFLNINIAFTNIRSIIPKRDELCSFINDISADMVILTETWLHDDVTDTEVFPSNLNFTIFRRDRKSKKGGGVLIAIKNTLASSLILHDDKIELIWVLVSNGASKFVFGVCYRPPDSHPDFCDLLHQSLHTITNKHSNAPIFLFGDFNYPSISWSLLSASNGTSSKEQQFLNTALDFNLHQAITCPTRGNNILDLLLTSSPDDIKTINTLPGLSDHNLIHICIASPLKKKSPTRKVITDYKRANFDAINHELANFLENFRNTHLKRSVNCNWELFKTTMLNLKNKYIPSTLIKSDSNCQWFNKQLKLLCNRKKRLYRTARLSQSSTAWERYRACANQYLTELKAAKIKFFSHDLLSILQSNPSKFWRMLSPKSQSNRISLTNADGEPIHADQCASALNDHFTSVFSSANTTDTVTLPESAAVAMPEIEITPEGIFLLINNLKVSSSAGCDSINSKLLKNTVSVSSQILCLIFTQSLQTGNVPDDWKKAQVIPIFKSGNRAIPANYRPISLTSIPSKMLEHIIASNLMTYLESIKFFFDHQHGFRKQLSCETQLAEFTHDILHFMDENLQTDAIFLDFSKAFDRVPHNLLLSKLCNLGIPPNIIFWIENFLKNRKQFTSANDHDSPLSDVTSGVPQGACLSPLLFLIYINDLPTNVLTKLRLFADDCVLYSPICTPDDSIKLQHDLNLIVTWCDKSLMPLNLTKCKIMSFTRKKSPEKFTYSIKSVPISPTLSYKYLGVHLSSSLSWSTHIQIICSEASRTLGYLRRNLKLASPDIKKLAYETYVRPKLEYACSIWQPSQTYLTNDLERIQNRAARFIYSQYSNDISVTALKESLKLPSLESRRIISRLCLMHAFYYHPQSRHVLLQPSHRTSSRINHSHPIAPINGHTSAMITSFFPNGITLWNKLPDNIVTCNNRQIFRSKLKCHMSQSN